jgi:hypothetical protein
MNEVEHCNLGGCSVGITRQSNNIGALPQQFGCGVDITDEDL